MPFHGGTNTENRETAVFTTAFFFLSGISRKFSPRGRIQKPRHCVKVGGGV